MSVLLLVLVLLSGFVPACYVATALPALWIIQNTALGVRSVLISTGGVDLTLVDGVIVLLLIRFLLSLIESREIVFDRAVYLSIAFFVAVNFLATLTAGVKFGSAPLHTGIVALARLGSEIALVPILAQSVTSLTRTRGCIGILLCTILVLGLIQFINFFGASHGFSIGEVQGAERGELRYFGPVGDSIGFVLLLGYIAALCAVRPAVALLFAGGIVLTAGIGAIVGTMVATALVVIFGMESVATRAFLRRYLWLVPVLSFIGLVAAVTFGRTMGGTLVDRLSSGKFHQSGGQRVATATLGTRMIADNPLTGVGFMGYACALERYGGKHFFDLAKLDGGTANANNQILQALTDSGIFGLLAFLALVATSARLFWKVSTRCDDALLRVSLRAACLWLLTQLFGNLAAVWLVPSSYVARFLWLLLGITVAIARLLPQSALIANRSAR